ncbi:MAG: glycoside hydrolase family 130 protein [Armatimonadota bacterium]
MKVDRFTENPIVTPADVKPSRDDFEVICTFNAGVIRHGGEILLLMRVAERPANHDSRIVSVPFMNFDGLNPALEIAELSLEDPEFDFSDSRVVTGKGKVYLTSISHLRLARSRDGRHFTVEEHPALCPDKAAEAYGLEDPRITKIDDTYYIVYKSVAPNGITQSLATTKDFVTYEKRGLIFPPENMDAMIFPEKINGRYAAIHRPVPRMIGEPNMWVSYSHDLIHWGDHKFMAGVMPGGWEGGRIGGGAIPFMTERGWLEIYHGATACHRYCLGAMLMEADRPERVIARTMQPIMEPEADYEVKGFVPNVVFTCGALVDGDRVTIYYGGADTVIAGAEMSVRDILRELE